MRPQNLFAALAASVLVASCCGDLPKSPQPTAAPAEAARLGKFALKASDGSYVSCSMTPDTAGHIGLFADRTAIDSSAVFTAQYKEDGHFGIVAANGKVITADRNMGSVLLADRDYVGDWETFELVDGGNGLFSLKNSNGQFVGAHLEAPGSEGRRGSQLIADRLDANDWERFTVVRDPAIGQ